MSAKVYEWLGKYSMNHDGWVGTLLIEDTKGDCAGPPWCEMVLRYVNPQGIIYKGEISVIDQDFQHMKFYINFPNNKQEFDAYLFSWDKSKIAGVTYWHNRTFGFYAFRTSY